MKNMEKEPKIEKSREDQLREKGYQIEQVHLSEDKSLQCDKCMDENKDFQFHQEGWFVEGEFYCPKHKERALEVLEEINQGVERRKSEQERIVEERRKQSGLK